MSLTATTNDDQGKRPTQTLAPSPRPLSPSITSPSDPSDVEYATLQHRRPTDVKDSELGAEGERPTYDDAVAEEIGGDYDYAEADTSLNDDDDGDDGELDVDEDVVAEPELEEDDSLEDESLEDGDLATEDL